MATGRPDAAMPRPIERRDSCDVGCGLLPVGRYPLVADGAPQSTVGSVGSGTATGVYVRAGVPRPNNASAPSGSLRVSVDANGPDSGAVDRERCVDAAEAAGPTPLGDARGASTGGEAIAHSVSVWRGVHVLGTPCASTTTPTHVRVATMRNNTVSVRRDMRMKPLVGGHRQKGAQAAVARSVRASEPHPVALTSRDAGGYCTTVIFCVRVWSPTDRRRR